MVGFPVALEDMPVTEWASAINTRHSRRTFTGRPVDPGVLAGLRDYCLQLPGHSVARVAVVESVRPDLFKGLIVGSYGRVIGARSALVVIGKPAERAVQESMGYLGEAALLQATVMDLGTCWIAGSFDRGVAASLVDIAADEQIFAVSPVGHAVERPRSGERVLKAMVRAKHRRPVMEVAPGFDAESWPEWAAEGVRLARVAPSAVNRQPWRFDLETGAMKVSVVARGAEGSVSRLLDVGIAMLHFEVGARLMGAMGTWQLLEPPGVARYHVAGDESSRLNTSGRIREESMQDRAETYSTISVATIATLAHVDLAEAQRWTEDPSFPRPVAELSVGKYYDRLATEKWLLERGHKGLEIPAAP